MKITESKLREMIRGVIREYSSSGGSSGGHEAGTDKQDAESGNEPKVDSTAPQGTKYWYSTSEQDGLPAKYYVSDWDAIGKAYSNDPSAKKKSSSPWTANPDYTEWEKAMADAKAEDEATAKGGQGDQPTGGGAGASTGGKRGKKGKKKKGRDDEE